MKNDSFEDWRGLGKPITIKNVSKSVILGILKNGNISDLKPVNIE